MYLIFVYANFAFHFSNSMKSRNRYLAVAISLLIFGALVYYFSNVVAYVLVAWVLSMIGQPLMRFFKDKIRIGRFYAGPNFCAALVLALYFIILAGIIGLFVPLVVEQANNLAEVDYSAIAGALEEPLQQFNNWLARYGMLDADAPGPEEQIRDELIGWFEPALIGNFFGSLISTAGNLFVTIFSIVFITFFFLKEQRLFVNFLTALVPNAYENQMRRVVIDVTRLLTRYFVGIMGQITVITIIVSVALQILGVKNALLIGFFAGLINVIPYLGPVIGAAFGVFITISSNLDISFYNEMLPLILKVVVVFGAMQVTDNFVLQPLIFSTSVLAHPLEIFIVILIGAQLNGIVGMVLAIPAYTVLRVVAASFLSEFKIVQQLTGRMK